MPAGGLIDPAQVERFGADLERLCPGDGPLLLAVSGGPDSFAMLALAHAVMPTRVRAATVDHRLRPENAVEADMVAGWCADRGIAHATLVVVAPPNATGNLQRWARQQRYSLLRHHAIRLGATALATAHHADDQAETFLMRAARGSGLSGLSAIRERLDQEVPASLTPTVADGAGGASWPDGFRTLATIRPLLGWRRADLRTLCETLSLPFVDDPSNGDARFDRTRFRDWLAAAPWFDVPATARSAAHLAEAERDLLEISGWLYAQRRSDESLYVQTIEVAALPRGVRRVVARIAIESVRMANGIQAPPWSSATNIEPLLDALEAGHAATQAGVLATPRGNLWRFSEAPHRRTG